MLTAAQPDRQVSQKAFSTFYCLYGLQFYLETLSPPHLSVRELPTGHAGWQSPARAVQRGLPGSPHLQVGVRPSAAPSAHPTLSPKGMEPSRAVITLWLQTRTGALSSWSCVIRVSWAGGLATHPLLVYQWVEDFQWRDLPFLPLKRYLRFSCITGTYITMMPWKAGIEDSIVGRLLSRYSSLRCRAHGGSLLQTCALKRHSYWVFMLC